MHRDPDRYADLNERISRRLDRDAEVEPRRPVTRRPFVRFECAVDHAAAKYDPALWSTLTPIGVQHVPADETSPAYDLVLANCVCGTTLSRVVEVLK